MIILCHVSSNLRSSTYQVMYLKLFKSWELGTNTLLGRVPCQSITTYLFIRLEWVFGGKNPSVRRKYQGGFFLSAVNWFDLDCTKSTYSFLLIIIIVILLFVLSFSSLVILVSSVVTKLYISIQLNCLKIVMTDYWLILFLYIFATCYVHPLSFLFFLHIQTRS